MHTRKRMSMKYNVTVVGSGNWATALAKTVANNVINLPDFEDRVNMYVYEEEYLGANLTDWINTHHVNPKYLQNVQLPENLYAVSDILASVRLADYIIFSIPKYFVMSCCKTLMGHVKPTAVALILARQLERVPRGGIGLTTQLFMTNLKIPCSIMTGANLAVQMVNQQFSDITIGCRDPNVGRVWKSLIQNDLTRVVVTNDVPGVELCSGLKSVVALAAGFCDGLRTNENYKPAVIRLGLQEMIRFADTFFPTCKMSTFFQTCGMADLILACYGSRNRLLGEVLVEKRKPVQRLEEEFVDGQQVPGPRLSRDIHTMLKQKGLEDKFPIFSAVYKIVSFRERPDHILDKIMNAPSDIYHPINLTPL